LLTRELDFARRFVPDALPTIVGSSVTIVLALTNNGVWSLAIGDAVRAVIDLILCFVVLRRPVFPRWHGEMLRPMWRFAGPSLAAYPLEFGLQNVDYALVGRILGPVALGYYTLAFRIAILPFLTVTFVIAGVAFPAYARLELAWERIRSLFRLLTRVTGTLAFLLGGGVVALAPSLVLLGHKWE